MPGNGLLRTKSIERSIRDTDEPNSKLKKSLGAFDLTVFGVAVVVGAGIFSVAASTAGNMAGPSVSLAFIMAAVTCGLAALCYAEFASTVPVAGSAYTFSYATFGELIAWIIGWDLVLEFAVAASVISKSWSSYLAEVLGLAGADLSPVTTVGPVTVDWGAMFIAGLITVLLVAGTKLSSRVNQVITAIKVTVVLVVIVVGIGYVNPRTTRRSSRRRRLRRAPTPVPPGSTSRCCRCCSAAPGAPTARSVCSPPLRRCSSRSSASTSWPPRPRRPAIPSGTCPAASSARW